MKKWTAEIMTDPARAHRLHVELMDGGRYRAKLYEDDAGELQLQLYDGSPGVIPLQWLMDVVSRFKEDLRR